MVKRVWVLKNRNYEYKLYYKFTWLLFKSYAEIMLLQLPLNNGYFHEYGRPMLYDYRITTRYICTAHFEQLVCFW